MNAFSKKTVVASFVLATALTFFGCSGGDKEDNPQPQPYETYSSSDANTGDSSSSDYTDDGSSSSSDDTENGGYSSSSEDNRPKEVISTRIQTMTVYDRSSGEITSTSEYRNEYEYNSDGSLKQMILMYENGANALYEYNSNGDLQRLSNYDADGNISFDSRYQTTTAIINSIERTTQQIIKLYNASGEFTGYTQEDYDWNSDASFCNLTTTSYNSEGEQISSSTYERRYTYVTIGSKTLEAGYIQTLNGNDISKWEYEYNDKGDMTMSILYSRQTDTGILVKSNESTFTYTYITL